MQSKPRPELKEPVLAFTRRLAELGPDGGTVPLADLAGLFGADPELRARVETRGDIRFTAGGFSNDGPEMSIAAGRVELEIPSLMRGNWTAAADGFTLEFPLEEYTLRACATLGFLRKCFALRSLRADGASLTLDFGNAVADRRYTF